MKYIFFLAGLLFSGQLFAQVQVGTNIYGKQNNDYLGTVLDISADGNTVIAGTNNSTGGGVGAKAGQARVFRLNNGSWNQLGADINGKALDDQLGSAVTISADGNTIAVSAPNNDANGSNSGQVQIYRFDNSSWTQLGGDINGASANDKQGSSLALSGDGNIVAIGARNSSPNGSGSGQVRVFQLNAGTWIQLGSNINGDAAGDAFGFSIDLSEDGNTLAIAAPNNDANGNASGLVRVFTLNAGNWNQVGGDIKGKTDFDLYGASLKLSADGKTLAFGARKDGNGNPHCLVYQLSNGNWIQLGTSIYDGTGDAVAMSGDGKTVAIGSSGNSANGNNSGRVQVYRLTNGNWINLGNPINGKGSGNQLGWAVALSNDGTRVAGGAPANSENGFLSGLIQVFRLCDPAQSGIQTVQASGQLGAGNCSVQFSAQATGNSFVFTGPNGYTYSNVFRQSGLHNIVAEGIRQPGVYTFKAVGLNECLQPTETTTTLTVTGSSCQE